MNSTAPIGQKQTGKLVQGRLANTMPADMNKKRSLTATTKTIGKSRRLFGKLIFPYISVMLISAL